MGPLSPENLPTTAIKRASQTFIPGLYEGYLYADNFYRNIPTNPIANRQNTINNNNVPRVTSKNTLQKFKDVILGKNIVRSNQFYATIPIPRALQSLYNVNDENLLRFSCYKADIPGIELLTSDFRTTGPMYKIPYNVSYPIMALEFYCVGEMDQKRIFDDWREVIQDPTDYQMAYAEDYQVTLHIETYINTIDESTDNYKKLYGVVVEKAFPITIDTLTNDWEEPNQIRRLRIGFAYKQWLRDDYIKSSINYKITYPQDPYNTHKLFNPFEPETPQVEPITEHVGS